MTSPPTQGQWLRRSATALIWTLTAASALYWGSRVAAGPGAAVAAPEAPKLAFAADGPARQAAVARVLGAVPTTASAPEAGAVAAQRFALLGVIASVTGQGAALISVDGQPARPLSVGAQIAPGYVLQAVGRREAVLVDREQVAVQLVLPLPAPLTRIAAAQPSTPDIDDAPAEAAPAVAAQAMPAEPATTAAAVPPSPATEPGTDTGPPARQDSRYRSPASLRRQERAGRGTFNPEH